MASAVFTGNIFDEIETQIDCSFQAYHVQQNKWSDVRTSELKQFSIDLADTDWLTNSNTSSNSSEAVIIAFWQDGADISGLKSRFSLVKINLTGKDAYVLDVQLIPKTDPTCAWDLTSLSTINHTVTANPHSSDVYQWDFRGNTFKHDDFYYTNMFDSVGQLSYEYDWLNGFVSSNIFSYTNIGDYNVTMKTTNAYGLTSECQKPLHIKYNSPSGILSVDNASPILNDIINVSFDVTDIDDRVTKIEHYVDGVFITDTLNLNSVYNHLLDINHTYSLKSLIYWNDGFNDLIIEVTKGVALTNVPPTVNLEITNSLNTYTLISNAFDYEGLLSQVLFRINIDSKSILEETPLVNDWVILDTKYVAASPWNQDVVFYKGGKFKIECYAVDDKGAISLIDTEIIDIEVSSDICNDQTVYFDWE